jgi:hypothetical protein
VPWWALSIRLDHINRKSVKVFLLPFLGRGSDTCLYIVHSPFDTVTYFEKFNVRYLETFDPGSKRQAEKKTVCDSGEVTVIPAGLFGEFTGLT